MHECFVQEESRKKQWEKRVASAASFVKNRLGFWDFLGAQGWSKKPSGWSQSTSRVTFLWKFKQKYD